jgi:hypothetical protein
MLFLEIILAGFADVLGVFLRWRFSLAAFAGLLAVAILSDAPSGRLAPLGWAVLVVALVAGAVWEYRDGVSH